MTSDDIIEELVVAYLYGNKKPLEDLLIKYKNEKITEKVKKMDIAVDLDGVVWDIMTVFLEIYNEDYGKDIKRHEVDDWYFFPQKQFEHTYAKTIKRIMDFPVLDENIKHYLFLLNGIYNVKILTQEENTEDVLEKKLISIGIRKGFEYLELIRVDRISGDKLDYKFDIYIDDNPNMIPEMVDYPDRILICYQQPWNTKYKGKELENVIRVNNWKEVMETIARINR